MNALPFIFLFEIDSYANDVDLRGQFAFQRLVKVKRTEKIFDRALEALSNDIEDNEIGQESTEGPYKNHSTKY